MAVMQRLKHLNYCYIYLCEHPWSPRNQRRLQQLISQSRKLGQDLNASFKRLKKGPFKQYLCDTEKVFSDEADLNQFAIHLKNRFETVVKPGIEQVQKGVERLISNCTILLRKGTNHEKRK